MQKHIINVLYQKEDRKKCPLKNIKYNNLFLSRKDVDYQIDGIIWVNIHIDFFCWKYMLFSMRQQNFTIKIYVTESDIHLVKVTLHLIMCFNSCYFK